MGCLKATIVNTPIDINITVSREQDFFASVTNLHDDLVVFCTLICSV